MSRLAGEREIFARTSERSRRMRRRGMAARGGVDRVPRSIPGTRGTGGHTHDEFLGR